ncbi:MAG: hypothetical protein ACREQV_25445, partial [Candidatus Binatia bacterium]
MSRHQKPASLRPLLVAIVWVVLFWWPGAAGRAAEQLRPRLQPDQTKEAARTPAAIPASEIIPRAEQNLRTLQETRLQSAADSEAALSVIQAELASFSEKSEKRWKQEVE